MTVPSSSSSTKTNQASPSPITSVLSSSSSSLVFYSIILIYPWPAAEAWAISSSCSSSRPSRPCSQSPRRRRGQCRCSPTCWRTGTACGCIVRPGDASLGVRCWDQPGAAGCSWKRSHLGPRGSGCCSSPRHCPRRQLHLGHRHCYHLLSLIQFKVRT